MSHRQGPPDRLDYPAEHRRNHSQRGTLRASRPGSQSCRKWALLISDDSGRTHPDHRRIRVKFSAPTREQLHEYQLVDRKYFDNGEHYVWLCYRAVEEDLTRWPDSALFLEYRWRNELEPSHFPEHVLTEEGPDSNLLNEQIAFRAATEKMTNISKADESAELLWQLQDTAVSFLGKSRAREAAALFEFHTKRYPGDARGLNNWGFCKIPLDPGSALALLQQAEHLGFDDKLVNVYNQICCLVRLNRIGEALDRAESYWQRELEDDLGGFQHPGGWVWIASEGELWAVSNFVDTLFTDQAATAS